MRIYLPATMPLLASWAKTGSVPPGPAFAVTPALRESYASGDSEELEFAATAAAGRASLRRLAADPDAVPRRVVLALDAPDELVAPDAPPGQVRLSAPVAWHCLAAVLADDAQGEPCIAAAVAALRDPSARAAVVAPEVEDTEGEPLSWFAVQEVADLIAGV